MDIRSYRKENYSNRIPVFLVSNGSGEVPVSVKGKSSWNQTPPLSETGYQNGLATLCVAPPSIPKNYHSFDDFYGCEGGGD